MNCTPAKAFYGERESVSYENAVGRTAAGLVTPYPPGIPLLLPGQAVETGAIAYLRSLLSQNVHVQGIYDGEIYVVKET